MYHKNDLCFILDTREEDVHISNEHFFIGSQNFRLEAQNFNCLLKPSIAVLMN